MIAIGYTVVDDFSDVKSFLLLFIIRVMQAFDENIEDLNPFTKYISIPHD